MPETVFDHGFRLYTTLGSIDPVLRGELERGGPIPEVFVSLGCQDAWPLLCRAVLQLRTPLELTPETHEQLQILREALVQMAQKAAKLGIVFLPLLQGLLKATQDLCVNVRVKPSRPQHAHPGSNGKHGSNGSPASQAPSQAPSQAASPAASSATAGSEPPPPIATPPTPATDQDRPTFDRPPWHVGSLALLVNRVRIPAICGGIDGETGIEIMIADAGGHFLRLFWRSQDADSGAVTTMFGRKHYVSKFAAKNEILQTLLAATLQAAEHEIRESFLYDGTPIYRPHQPVDALRDFTRQHRAELRLDVRNEAPKSTVGAAHAIGSL